MSTTDKENYFYFIFMKQNKNYMLRNYYWEKITKRKNENFDLNKMLT